MHPSIVNVFDKLNWHQPAALAISATEGNGYCIVIVRIITSFD